MIDTIDEIRKRVEAEHQEAVRALRVLEKYLDRHGQTDLKNGATPPVTSPLELHRYSKGGRSISVRVLAAVQDWATVAKIRDKTGLDTKQVRGVLNAPRYKASIERREADGQTEYRIRQTGQQGG